ncbi:hypothetical protein H5410_042554 [Solanum commersonii]|uniref:Reverse transcriptase n=1 Tax=Solanum commersonii TaxID=4109 RepID=A0A9J5XXU1_SOLCO|nr:hypothetical protein H5410_042554 [Solanum commersonii]
MTWGHVITKYDLPYFSDHSPMILTIADNQWTGKEQINQQCTDELLCKEKQTLLDIEKWSLVEESALRQKSRAKWIQLGDGTKLNTPKVIKEEVVQFYKALMRSNTTSLPAVDRNTMKKGPTIAYEQGVALCGDVMDDEIWKALTSIGDDKAPGVDGSNTITKRALIAWDKVCLPKSVGGMHLINIRLWNQVVIAKTCWDLAHKSNKLWIRWIHLFYIKNQQFFNASIPKKAS